MKGIESDPFGGVELTGADAEAFQRLVDAGPTEEQRRVIADAIKRGTAMAQEMRETGKVVLRADIDTATVKIRRIDRPPLRLDDTTA